MSPVTLKELKNFARTIVDPLMVDGFDKVLAGELPAMVKLDKTLVSKVDKDINQAVIGYFSQFSDLDIIGEEDDGHLMTNGLVHEEMLELIKKYTITNPGY